MRVVASRRMAAPIQVVWEIVSDPTRALDYMSGVTRWEVEGEQERGRGARYRMLLRVGAAQVGGVIEVVEWDEPRELAWTSVTGVDQRGRFRLRSTRGGQTQVEIRLAYGVPGAGPVGWLVELLAARAVAEHLRRTLLALERTLEHERLRRRAQARQVRGAAGAAAADAERTRSG
jgi:uncharacterized membrane protein